MPPREAWAVVPIGAQWTWGLVSPGRRVAALCGLLFDTEHEARANLYATHAVLATPHPISQPTVSRGEGSNRK